MPDPPDTAYHTLSSAAALVRASLLNRTFPGSCAGARGGIAGLPARLLGAGAAEQRSTALTKVRDAVSRAGLSGRPPRSAATRCPFQLQGRVQGVPRAGAAAGTRYRLSGVQRPAIPGQTTCRPSSGWPRQPPRQFQRPTSARTPGSMFGVGSLRNKFQTKVWAGGKGLQAWCIGPKRQAEWV